MSQSSFESLQMIIPFRKCLGVSRELIPQFANKNQLLFR